MAEDTTGSVEEQAQVISSLTPLSPQEAKTAIAIDEGGGMEKILELTGRESEGGGRNARSATKNKMIQANILSQYDLEEVAEYIRTDVPAIPSYGLRGVELYIGDIGTGKSVLAKTHAHELLNGDNPPAVIAVDFADVNGWKNLLRHHDGETKTVIEDQITTPEHGAIEVWNCSNMNPDDEKEMYKWFNELIEVHRGEFDHDIVIFVDNSQHYVSDEEYSTRLYGTGLPEHLSIRAIGWDTQRGLASFLQRAKYQRIHTFRTDGMIGEVGEGRTVTPDKEALRLSDTEWQWTQNAGLGCENNSAEVLVKEYRLTENPTYISTEQVSKPMYVRFSVSEEMLNIIESEETIEPETGEVDWDEVRENIISSLKRMEAAQEPSTPNDLIHFPLRNRRKIVEYKQQASAEQWESLCEIATENQYDLEQAADPDGFIPPKSI